MENKEIALVLSSGGARGLAHIGAIEELASRGYHIHSVAGCSMGALVGGIYAAGRLAEFREWMKNADRWTLMNLADITPSLNHIVKGDKVYVFHKRRRKGYRKFNGHRQQFTELTIKQVIA